MAIVYELWNDLTNNLIDDFDTEQEALAEVRARIAAYGQASATQLSLLRSTDSGAFEAVAIGDALVRRAFSVHLSPSTADD